MIYLDNAATTYPKPPIVLNAISTALKKYGANPGRSGHYMSMSAAEEIYNCRKTCANFFNAPGPECVIFTLNCTHATNIVIKGLLKPGDHVVLSCLEHNAVSRPVHALKEKGIDYTKALIYPYDNDQTVNSFREAFQENTKLVICMHASNVLGLRLPIERICALAHQYNIFTMIDAAQTAGVLDIDVRDIGIDFLCTSGHKSLYGPMGTGLLITDKGHLLSSFIEGGTGTDSLSLTQPDSMPEHLESGTSNMPGICGLQAGIKFIQKLTLSKILAHEHKLICKLYDKLSMMSHVKLYTKCPDTRFNVPLLSFNVTGKHSEEVSSFLNSHNIAVRSGLHCAAFAHSFLNTTNVGTVRVCPSVFTREKEIDMFVHLIKNIEK